MMCLVLLEFTIKISECYADLPEICKRYEYDYKKIFPSLIFLSGVLIVQGNLRKRRKKIMRIVLTQCHAGFVGRSPFTFWSQRKLVVSHHQLFPDCPGSSKPCQVWRVQMVSALREPFHVNQCTGLSVREQVVTQSQLFCQASKPRSRLVPSQTWNEYSVQGKYLEIEPRGDLQLFDGRLG